MVLCSGLVDTLFVGLRVLVGCCLLLFELWIRLGRLVVVRLAVVASLVLVLSLVCRFCDCEG